MLHTPSGAPGRNFHHWPAVCLLLVFFLAGANSLVRDSATFDETAHLPAGFTYLDRGDFRLNPEHPPLAKAWAALPLWLGGLARPDYASPYWTGRPSAANPALRSKADEWLFGFEFLNGPLAPSAPRKDPTRFLVPARMAMLLLGMALALVVYVWSLALWGRRGALFSLFLTCLSPTLLAHARLVNTDLPSALGFCAALWGFWRFCLRPSWGRAALAGLLAAVAALFKFSTLLLGPMIAIVGVTWALWPGVPPRARKQRWLWLGTALLLIAAIAYVGIWAGYGFRFAAAEPGYQLDWSVVGLKEGPVADSVHRALENRILPEGYLYGLAYFLGGAARRVAFLNGEQSLVGWWYYFPEAFLLKTPPALLWILAWLGAVALTRHRWRSFHGWFLALPALVYLAVSIGANLNIGHRHLVPLYPLLFVLAGALPGHWRGRPGRKLAALALIAGYAVSFVVATPRYLSYFNFIAGGAGGGWRYLLDSNIDWGQDLARLARWIDRNGREEIDLAYFGTADPAAYGIRYRKILMVHDFHPSRPPVLPEPGRIVAVSVNLLQGLYFDQDRAVAEELARRGWITRAQVTDWLALRDRLSLSGRRHPSLAEWAVAEKIIDEEQRRRVESSLLSAWFRRLRDEERPLAKAGDSIFIYRAP